MKNRNKPKFNWKRFGLMSAVSVVSFAGTGASVFAGMSVHARNARPNTDEIETPDDFSNNTAPIAEDGFSLTVNNLLANKAVAMDELDIVLYLNSDTAKPLTLRLKDLHIDLSKINQTLVSLDTNVEINYNGLSQTVFFALEDLTKAYVSALNGSFALQAPRTIQDVMNLVSRFVALPSGDGDSSAALDSLNIADIAGKAQDILSGINITENKKEDGSFVYDINLGNLTVDDININNLDIQLSASEDHQVTGVVLATGEKPISIVKDGETLLRVYGNTVSKEANGAAVHGGVTYESVDGSRFTDVDDANHSVFSSLGRIFTRNGDDTDMKAGIRLSADIQDTTPDAEKALSLGGDLFVDARGITKNFSMAKFGFDLESLKAEGSDEAKDWVKVSYTGSEEGSIYLDMDGYKGRLANSDSSQMLDYLTSATGERMIKVIGEALGKTMDSFSWETIKSGKIMDIISMVQRITKSDIAKDQQETKDLSNVDAILDNTHFIYNANGDTGYFELTLPSEKLGLAGSDSDDVISVKVHLNNAYAQKDKDGNVLSTGRITSIVVSGLRFNSIVVNDITIAPQDFDESRILNPTAEELTDYVDYRGTVGIFKSVADMIADKQVNAQYALTLSHKDSKDDTNSLTLNASGNIAADLTGVTSYRSFAGDTTRDSDWANGSYRVSMALNEGEDTLNHKVDISYLNHNLYLGYDAIGDDTTTIFRNKVSQASMEDIVAVLNAKTESRDAGGSLVSMGKLLDMLSFSEAFRNDIDTLKNDWTVSDGLRSFLAVKNGETADSIVLSLNVPYIFGGTALADKIGAITLTFNASTEKLTDIRVSTWVMNSDTTLSFVLSFPAFETIAVNDADYTEIKDADHIFKAFFDLPSDLARRQITLSGAVSRTQDGETRNLVTLNGQGLVDTTDTSEPYYGGSLTITHPALAGLYDPTAKAATQTFEFEAQKVNGDTQMVAEYNDSMHILMHQSSVKDLVGTITDTAKNAGKEDNPYLVLNALTKAQDMASSLDLSGLLKDKNAILRKYPIIHAVSFDDVDNTITIEISRRLFDATATDQNDFAKIIIGYANDTDMDSVILESVTVSTDITILNKDKTVKSVVSVNAGLGLKEFDDSLKPTILPYQTFEKDSEGNLTLTEDNSGKYINLDNVNTLVRSAIDTTEFNYFDVKGSFNLDLMTDLQGQNLKINALSFDLAFEYSAFIADSTVYQYVAINNGQKSDVSDNGFYTTEFFINDETIYVSQTRNDDGTITSRNYKTTATEVRNNLTYFALTEVLDLDSRPAGKTALAYLYDSLGRKAEENGDATTTESTKDGTTSDTLSALTKKLNIGLASDFSTLISSAVYEQDKQKFSLALDCDSLLTKDDDDQTADLKDYLSIDNTQINLYHQTIHRYGTREVVDDNGDATTVVDRTQDDKRIPFYGLTLSTDINVLPTDDGGNAALKMSLRGSASMSAKDGNLQRVTSDEAIADVKQDSMARYFRYTEAFETDPDSPTDLYHIDSYTAIKKEIYDFTKWELGYFYNTYEVNDNAATAVHTVCLRDGLTLDSVWFYHD